MRSTVLMLVLLVLSALVGCGGSGGALRSVGEVCSNDDTQICEGETFCKFVKGECSINSIRNGVCSEIPQVCPKIYRPVCGCDNTTYSNECVADSAAVSVLYDGECRPQ